MNTLFDYISNVNATQYGLALLFIIGFIIFIEILKPRPFEGLLKAAADDAGSIKSQGKEPVVRLIRNIASAPVYVMLYLAAVPLLFVRGMAVLFGEGISDVTSAGWSPVRAYFTGRRKAKKAKADNPGKRASD